jgi:carbamoyltransferase
MLVAKGPGPWNFCFAGGCALNIKWNSALRSLPLVAEMWVPPFPNDSGSAIGAAVLGRSWDDASPALSWHVRLGPQLGPAPMASAEWTAVPCGPQELARLLADTGEPVVVLEGRADLGPRSLGARSILAAATDPQMKDTLNRLKDREHFRPVAPVCLEAHASEVFDPGTPDPFMLYEHMVRDDWRSKVPAIVHLDGTARLQTVSESDNAFLAAVLEEYFRLTGIPVLCNTSANLKGCGFFPDVRSAMDWGGVGLVWSAGVLYRQVPRGSA